MDSEQEDTPTAQLQKQSFFSHLTWKKENNNERCALNFFYSECFSFYHQLRFLFHDSWAEQDGSPPPVLHAQQSLAAFARDLMLKCHSVCQGDTGTGLALFCGTSSGISEYCQYFRLWAFHRITESHRIVGVGRDLCGLSSPTLLPKQGHLQQAAQDLVQAGLEYLQRRRLNNLPGQPVPGLRHPQREEVLPHVQMELPVLQFVPVAPCPVTGHY